MRLTVILFGPQGSGKGVIGDLLARHYDIPLLGAGQLLRDAIKAGSPAGKVADRYIHRGLLVPSEVIATLIRERIERDDCRRGYIIDGFPRNLEQAKFFSDKMAEIGLFLKLDVPLEVSLQRLGGRVNCIDCAAVYSTRPEGKPQPRKKGFCDECGGELLKRKDDQPSAIRKRFEIYSSETQPLIDQLGEKVVEIDAGDAPEMVLKRIITLVKRRFG